MKIRPILAGTCLVAASGCGLADRIPEEGQTRTMNMQEAGDRAERILDRMLGAIKPPVETIRGPSSDAVCTDFKNDATGSGQVIRRRHVMTIISAERRGSFLGVVERAWKRDGYEITSVRKNRDMPAMFATTPEGFRVSLLIGYKGQAFFDVTTPCVTESQVTEPPRTPIDPHSPAAKGLPYIHSKFWSASSPVPHDPRAR